MTVTDNRPAITRGVRIVSSVTFIPSRSDRPDRDLPVDERVLPSSSSSRVHKASPTSTWLARFAPRLRSHALSTGCIECSGMSRTITISSWSASNVTVRCCDGSSCSPAKISSYILAMRTGVRTRPSRSGSSPIASRISRTARSIRSRSMGFSGPEPSEAGGMVLASVTRILRSGAGRRTASPRPRCCDSERAARPPAAHCARGLVTSPTSHMCTSANKLLHPLGLERLVHDQLAREPVEDLAVVDEHRSARPRARSR